MNETLNPTGLRRAIAMTVAALLFVACSATAQQDTGGDAATYVVERVAEGLERPWGMEFLPDGRLLVTERPGGLLLVDVTDGSIERIDGTPDVAASGQGGLLDVAIHPRFDEEPWVYFTWSAEDDAGLSTTHMGRARLDMDALALEDLETLHVAEPFLSGTAHYGSRIVFDAAGYLFMTVGDRNRKDFGPNHVSQDTSHTLGSTLRFAADGSVPNDNPFVGDPNVHDAIYSYGHRNSQGMAVHPETGELWQNEHGENNGDEINVIVAGGNYGWPIATFGVDYRTREPVGDLPPNVPETIDPVFHWDPEHPEGFPPSGFAFYDGEAFPEWQGNAFMGNLAHQFLGRFTVDGHEVELVERMLEGEGWRIRDVAVGPDDGFVYVIVDAASAPLVRLRPAGTTP